MNISLAPMAASVVAVLLAASGVAQVPDGHLVVATASLPPTASGQAGLWLVDLSTGSVVAVTPSSLPCELRGTCGGSAGSNCVVRDPRTERLVAGNAVLNGGPVGAWLLDLQGATVVTSTYCPVGTVSSFDGGVHAAAFLPDGDILLATGRITTGANAYAPILRWTPPNPQVPAGALVVIALPALYATTGNYCNALVVSPDGSTLFAACKSNGLFSQNLLFDVLCIPLNGGPVVVLPDSMVMGEFVSQLWWDCNGDLLGATARYPTGVAPGRLMRWRLVGGVWVEIVPAQSWSGLLDANAGVTDPATCDVFLNFNNLTTTGLSPLYRTNGTSTPTPILAPVPSWGLVMGIDVNPNPEVFEQPSGASLPASWSYRPFAGGVPTIGNAQFALPLRATGTGIAAAFVDFVRTPGVTVLGMDVYLPFTAVALATLPTPSLPNGPVWPFPIPNNAGLLNLEVFAQAAVADQAGLGASDLLQFTIR